MLETRHDDDPTVYPTSDGKPMAETDLHRELMVDLIEALKVYYADQDDVYVSGNILMYYEKGNKRKHLSPDVLVTLGIAKHLRDYYLVWLEGKAPDVVFEITSSSTRNEDLVKKKNIYARLGVKEYVLFDPYGDYLDPRLRLYRLQQGEYLPVVGDPLVLQTLPLQLVVHDDTLRLRDCSTGELLPRLVDTYKSLAQKEASLAQKEASLAQKDASLAQKDASLAEKDARIRELEAEIKRLQG